MDKGGGETFDGVSPPPSHVDGESSSPSPNVTQVSPGTDEAGAEVAVGTARRGH